MYIAFKWLVGLTLIMWISMCSLDIYISKTQTNSGDQHLVLIFSNRYYLSNQLSRHVFSEIITLINEIPRIRNKSSRLLIWDDKMIKDNPERLPRGQKESILIHYLLFAAGALVVSVFHRKNEIILYTKDKMTKINISIPELTLKSVAVYKRYLKNGAVLCLSKVIKKLNFVSNEIINHLKFLFGYPTCFINYLRNVKILYQNKESNSDLILLNKLEETVNEKREVSDGIVLTKSINLAQTAAEKETFRNDLIRKVEEHRTQLKQTNNLHHLYVITRHENIILKNRIKKISKEKFEYVRNLVTLINEIFCSRNNELKNFCSRFIVNNKNNLLTGDVEAEIKKFLENSRKDNDDACSSRQISLQDVESDNDIAILDDTEQKRTTGEYFCNVKDFLWTVKGKDGVIEKLYEYSYEPNRAIVRRIREYSVYFDKDRVMDRSIPDVTAAEASVMATTSDAEASSKAQNANICETIKDKRFLTNSPAFKKFLLKSKRPLALTE